jgi:predicted phosphodiesterase
VRVAALYDVEGNMPALEAVLAEFERIQPDAIVFGGDLFCGAQPVEVIDRARSLPNARFLLGNADRLDEPKVADQVALLRDDQRQFVATFPEKLVIRDVLYRHGSPRSVDELVTMLTPDDALRDMLDGIEQKTIVIGHTHTQFDRRINGHRIINAGSVGAAWETEPGAYWALIEDGDVELRRTDYDIEAPFGCSPPITRTAIPESNGSRGRTIPTQSRSKSRLHSGGQWIMGDARTTSPHGRRRDRSRPSGSPGRSFAPGTADGPDRRCRGSRCRGSSKRCLTRSFGGPTKSVPRAPACE